MKGFIRSMETRTRRLKPNTIQTLKGLRWEGGGECELMSEAEVASDAAVVSCLLLHVWALTRRHIKYCRQTMIYRLLRQELFRLCCANSASFYFFIQPIATITVPLTTSTVPMPEWKPSVQFNTTSHNFLCKAIQLTQPNCIFNTSFIRQYNTIQYCFNFYKVFPGRSY